MAQDKTDVPGNAVMSQALLDREVTKAGLAMFQLGNLARQMNKDELLLTSIKIKVNNNEGTDVLIILCAVSPDGPVVAFNDGDGIKEALMTTLNRIRNGRIRWKEDQYG